MTSPVLDFFRQLGQKFHVLPARLKNLGLQPPGSQAMNFLWLNLDLPAKPDPEDGSIREPLPLKYIENVREAGKNNKAAEMFLWVDSKRLTERQMEFLKHALEAGRPNVHLKDLRTIPAYATNPLYDEPETNPGWRNSQSTMIWRQVDAAKILVSLQGNFDQVFFADLDHAHLGITSPKVQEMIQTHGLMIGGSGPSSTSIENQLWGFNHSRRGFFEEYYEASLKAAARGENAWWTLVDKVRLELEKKEEIPLRQICLPIGGDGTHAEQPGHEWRSGHGKTDAPSLIPAGRLTGAFNTKIAVIAKTAPAQKAEAAATPMPPPALPAAPAGCATH